MSNPKADLHNIYVHIKFADNPSYCSENKIRMYCGQTDTRTANVIQIYPATIVWRGEDTQKYHNHEAQTPVSSKEGEMRNK